MNHDSPYCDACLTRVAVLALALRRVLVQAHRTAKHDTARWTDCDQEPCLTARHALTTVGITTTRD